MQRVVWAYCRVSTLKAEQELSLDQQLAWAKEVAKQSGARLVVFRERASAKTIMGRPECVRMLNALDSAPVQERPEMLIVTSFDRLSRDMTDTLILARTLRNANVQLYIRDRGVVPMQSFADQAALVGQAMGGHAENDARSARARASWARRRSEGKPMSNKSPYGLQLANERDTPEPATARWVLRAFQLYASGVGMPAIAKELQKHAPPHRVFSTRIGPDGQRIVRERNPVWEPNRVRKMFDQRRYRDVIVPADLFDRVQGLLNQKPHWKQLRRHEYPLSGAIKCRGCGRSFHGHATGATTCTLKDGSIVTYPKVRYYACTVCHFMLNAEELEARFESDLRRIQAQPSLIHAWVCAKPIDHDIPALQEESRKIQRRLASGEERRRRAWELALDGDPHVAADLPRELRRISDEERIMRERLNEIEGILVRSAASLRSADQAKRLLQKFWTLYHRAAYEQKRELAHTLVSALGGANANKDGIYWRQGGVRSLPSRSTGSSQPSASAPWRVVRAPPMEKSTGAHPRKRT